MTQDWISEARLSESLGKARELIIRGCEECPNNEDLWIEASRLTDSDSGKRILLEKGLEYIPDSASIWKQLVKLANDEQEAEILLQRAVTNCQSDVELWLALARLQTSYDASKSLLNRARQNYPKIPSIWIASAILVEQEEQSSSSSLVDKIILRAIHTLQTQGVEIDRRAWMIEAESAERAGALATCNALICNTIKFGMLENNPKATLVSDAEQCLKRGSIQTSRSIFRHTLAYFSSKKSIWLKAAQLEKLHGTPDSVDALLRKAFLLAPHAEVLWLMGSKQKSLAGDLPSAMKILHDAHVNIPRSEAICLAAFDLDFQNNNLQRAKSHLARAHERGHTGRVWMKSAILERRLGNPTQERTLLNQGLTFFPSFFKLWLMLGQLEERLSRLPQAKEAYELGLKHCPNSTPLWISLSYLEEKMTHLGEARSVLLRAIQINPQNPELWLATVRVESRHGSKQEADILMAKALQQCPNSGILWAASIEMAPTPHREAKVSDARRYCEHDPHVIAAVGKLFWNDGKVDDARTWLNSAVTLKPDVGDFWGLLYRFELQHGTENQQREVLKKCITADPKHGEKWQPISKAVENSHKPVEAILKKVVAAFGEEENKH